MPRIRYLKPDFFKDEHIAALPFWIRLLYQGLWILADRDGRLEDRPKRIKAEIFPYEDINVEEGLETLAEQKGSSKRSFIVRYEVNAEEYIQILKWHEHQKPHHTERPSKIPPPAEMVFRVGQQLSDYSKREDGSKEDGNEKGNGEGNGECSSNEHEVKERLDNGDITVQFESFWSRYPKPLGKVQAFEKFQASVRTRKDLLDFNKALDNYIASIAGREPQYIKSANNWVSAWREWISYMEKKCPKCGGKGKYTSSSGYDIWCPICRKDEREKAARRHGR